MTPQRFAAASSREALAAARAVLGADAVVLASRDHPLGVELIACAARALDQDESLPPTTQSRILAELARLRGMLQNQLAGFAWSETRRRDPRRVELMQTLYAAGFGSALARGLASRLPRGHSDETAVRWLRQVLTRNLALAGAGIFDAGRVALVGATGAGKTTTLAKIAARAARAHGAASVALIATDTWRMAATEQLAAYADLIGVGLYVARDHDELSRVLGQRRERLILIDTAGFNPADPRVEAYARLDALGVRRVLVLSAAQQGAALELAMNRLGAGAVAAIVSKLDEAPQPGAALDVLIRHAVPLAALATGQRVPEDFHLPNAAYLIERVLRGAQIDTPFRLMPQDGALVDAVEASLDTGTGRVA